jgi:acyl carrier protein
VTTGAVAPPAAEFYDEIMILLRDVTGEDEEWLAAIDPTTRLDGDLLMDSVEIALLSHLLRSRYGSEVDLPGLISSLDLDEIIALTVADVADLVAAYRAIDGGIDGGQAWQK